MLGRALSRCLFLMRQTGWGMGFYSTNCWMSSKLLSVEASSITTILQLVQFWFIIDCMLQSQRKPCPLFKVGTTMQNGCSGREKSCSLESRSYYVWRSYFTSLLMRMSSQTILKLFMARRQDTLFLGSPLKKSWLSTIFFMNSTFSMKCFCFAIRYKQSELSLLLLPSYALRFQYLTTISSFSLILSTSIAFFDLLRLTCSQQSCSCCLSRSVWLRRLEQDTNRQQRRTDIKKRQIEYLWEASQLCSSGL